MTVSIRPPPVHLIVGRFALLVTILKICIVPCAAGAKETSGWVEKVRVFPGDILVKAKIDTGAKTSSLHCTCMSTFERDGEEWVSFMVENYDGEKQLLERKLVRTAVIKRHHGESQERLVVKLGICLGSTYRETEVNLIDRSGLNYQMLIGRRFLRDLFVVDPSETFHTKPDCGDISAE